MLKQILQDMHVDPDLLAELDEEQKQLLFCKMREEQVRRWKEWESSIPEEKKRCQWKPSKPGRLKGKGKVNFLHGSDGKPWTWVMGEHPSDKTIEDILEAEAHSKANRLAKEEALIWQVKLAGATEGDSKLISEKSTKNARSYPPIAEKPKPEKFESILRSKSAANEKVDLSKLEQRLSTQFYKSVIEERNRIKETAAEESKQIDAAWKEQERMSKLWEEERRTLAKSAREVWSNSLSRVRTVNNGVDNSTKEEKRDAATLPLLRPARVGNYKNLGKDRAEMPANKEALTKWFQECEEPRGAGIDPKTGGIAVWFHGIIDRDETEQLLQDKPSGSFLIRVSDKIWGYAISYKSDARCKHFLIDASDNGYQFFGLYHVVHASLVDLVQYHKTNPLCVNSKEFLKHPVGQSKPSPDYEGLFKSIPLESQDSYL